jgi:hypothetical protein
VSENFFPFFRLADSFLSPLSFAAKRKWKAKSFIAKRKIPHYTGYFSFFEVSLESVLSAASESSSAE